MRINSIMITSRSEWDIKKTQSNYPYSAKITIDSEYGAVQLNIAEDKIQEIMGLISDAMADTVKDVAKSMTAEIILQQGNLLERDAS